MTDEKKSKFDDPATEEEIAEITSDALRHGFNNSEVIRELLFQVTALLTYLEEEGLLDPDKLQATADQLRPQFEQQLEANLRARVTEEVEEDPEKIKTHRVFGLIFGGNKP